jgi:dTDP-4-amino-4,6-dideoxygalactose transaminase
LIKLETMGKNIFVTLPSLAPLEEYVKVLNTPWDNKILTHNGPLVQKLEIEINNYLQLDKSVLVTNGTIALQLVIKALDIKGEIITTPFSWIATASAIRWEGCTPVFVDIDEKSFNIDPALIEQAITSNTAAIMPVHVFSRPCEIEVIESIAAKHNIKVIYDAAHAFGVNYKNKSILAYGDISCTSLHATKIYNTGEGGVCFSQNNEVYARLKRLRFFGHDENKLVIEDGLNGKMTEIHAALGLVNLPYLNKVIERRKEIFEIYYNQLNNIEDITFQDFKKDEYNYSYMPIVIKNEKVLLTCLGALNDQGIFPRRYFFPSLNTISCVRPYIKLPVSESISRRVLCLPSHNYISNEDIITICKLIKESHKNKF